ncbi:MAG: DUF4136 domain-containing protein [Oleispira sp.]|nr:DUF4136 domain-containing protein [Oleispira sp.]MBL4882464.1 DUF4136 domain-containing protein [Oleispira sp.]
MKLHSLVLILTSTLFTACASQTAMDYKQAESTSISQYTSFTISPLDIKGHDHQVEAVVEIAIKSALVGRGLTYLESDADLEVQYAAGVKSTRAVDLKPVSIGSAVYTSHNVVSQTRATLVINVQDTKTNQNVWRSSGSRTIREGEIPQADINVEFAKIFQNFK